MQYLQIKSLSLSVGFTNNDSFLVNYGFFGCGGFCKSGLYVTPPVSSFLFGGIGVVFLPKTCGSLFIPGIGLPCGNTFPLPES